jgi:hypothetical protein
MMNCDPVYHWLADNMFCQSKASLAAQVIWRLLHCSLLIVPDLGHSIIELNI